MSSIFPLRERVSLGDDREPRLVSLDEEMADEVFSALSAETTRKIFLALHEEPGTASDLANATDTTVQNVQYHLEKLSDADLISVVDTWYSERGTEMKVYAPTDESLVLFAGRDDGNSLRQLLKRALGTFGVLVPASALVGLFTAWHQSPDTGVGPTTDAADDDRDVYHSEADDAPEDGDEPPEDDIEEDDVPDDSDVAPPDDDAEQPEADDAPDTEVDEAAEDADDSFELTNESGDVTFDGGDSLICNVSEGAEATAGVDPLLAAGLFFCGGLIVLVTLFLWG